MELLHCVLDGLIDRPPAQRFIGDTVNKKSIEALADTVHYCIPAEFVHDAAHVGRARCILNQVVNIAAVQRQVANLSGVHRLRQPRGLGVHRGRSICDLYYLCALSQEQLEIDAQHGAGVQNQIASLCSLKAVGLDADHVRANVQFFGCIDPCTVGLNLDLIACTQILQNDLGAWDYGSRWISDGTGYFAVLNLRRS